MLSVRTKCKATFQATELKKAEKQWPEAKAHAAQWRA
jgi:hypothetical protein